MIRIVIMEYMPCKRHRNMIDEKANVPGAGEATATEANANTSARTVEMNFIVSYSVEEVLGAEGGGKEWWERSAHRVWRPRAYIDCVI